MSGTVRRIDGRIVYENPWSRVREDRTRLPGGSEGLYSVVEKPDFAVVLPLHGDGTVTLVEQYRYPLGRRCLELPQGTVPESDAAPEAIAARELAEETGLRAERLVDLGRLDAMGGLTKQTYHGFLATGLRQGEAALEATEADLVCRRVPLAELRAMALDGRLTDAHSVATIAMAAWRGLLPGW